MTAINLIPQTVQLAQQRRYRMRRWAVAVFVAVAAVAVSAGVEWQRRLEADQLRAGIDQRQRELRAVRAEVRALTVQTQHVRRDMERAAALRSKRAWSGLFALIGSCMPGPCWLVSLATDPTAPGASAARSPARSPVATAEGTSLQIEAPRRLKLIGYAPDAADPHTFVTNLKAADVFARVALERSQREAALDGSYFRFELLCEW